MEKNTFCPLDCFDACAIVAHVEDGKVTRLSGNKDHPITRGFLCPKGYKLLDKVYSKERITSPVMRFKNEFHQISWEQAFDMIAERIEEILKKYGSSAILYYSGDGYEGYLRNIERLFFDHLGGATYSEGSLCWGAGLLAQKIDFGNSLCHSPFDIFNSNWIVLWGRNALWTNLHLYYFVHLAKKQGKKVAVIDIYPTETFRIADIGLVINPGSDSYLAYGAIKYILENGKEDKEFIEKYTLGFEKVKEIASRLTYEEVEKKCGIQKKDIEDIANIYTQSPVSTYIGYGPQRYLNGVNTIRTIDYLVAISGNVGIKGGGSNFAHRYTKGMDSIFKDDSKAVNKRFYNKSKLGMYLKDVKDPPVEMVYISAGNPVSQCPDSDLVFNELRKRFVVVVDMFLTATAQAATIILPAASFLEKEDVFVPSMWHDYIGVSEKVIKNIGQSKSEVEIINELAKRLNLDFPIKSEREWVEFVKAHFEKSLNIKFNKYFARATNIDVPWQDKIFETKSGKFEFESKSMGVAVPLADWQRGLKNQLRLVSVHSQKTLHSQEFFERKPVAFFNIDDAKRLGIRDNDKVLLYNQCGSFIVEAVVKQGIKRGYVIVEEGFQNHNIETLNSCIFPLTAEMDSQAAFNSNFVFVRKVAL